MSGYPHQVLWRITLPMGFAPTPVSVPASARIVHAAWYRGGPTVWYLVEQGQPTTQRLLQVVATGQVMPPHDKAIYQRTVVQSDDFVWHIFELVSEADA